MVGRTKVAGSFAWLKIASRQLLCLIFTSFLCDYAASSLELLNAGCKCGSLKAIALIATAERPGVRGPTDSLRFCRAESCPNDNFE